VDFIDRTDPRWGDLGALYGEAVADALRSGESVKVGSVDLPLVAPEFLVTMKVGTGEREDEADARRLLEAVADLDVERVRALVRAHLGPAGIGRFEALLREAAHPAAVTRDR
jgi:hypothetical protein